MLTFLCSAALLFIVAAGIVTRPLWSRGDGSHGLHRHVDRLTRQLRQLQELHADGALTGEQFEAGKAQVQQRLIAALEPEADDPAPLSAMQRVRLPFLLAAFMLGIVGGGYWLIGSPRHIRLEPGDAVAAVDTGPQSPEPAASAPHEVTAAQVQAMVDKLAARLKAQPDDDQGWLMLARSRVALGQHEQALDAFARASRLRPRDADLLADWADALAMAHGKSLDGEPTALLKRALAIDPHHAKALALSGTAAFDRKDYRQAVRDWETLVQVEPAGGPFAEQVRGGIAEARQLAGMPPPAALAAPAAPATSAANGAKATVTGTVTLAPALAARVSPDDVLFVFARAVDGPRMPLAIVRKRARDLPLAFTLDDSLAMSPDASLSSAHRVVVGARISRSGNAMAQDGDLEGSAAAVDVGATGVHVEIDQAVGR